MPFSHGKTGKDIRKFCRTHGVKPTAANVERMQREVTRTRAENEAHVRVHKELERERGIPSLVDNRGRDMKKVVHNIVQRDLDRKAGR